MAITEYEDKIKEIVNRENHSGFIYDFLSIYDRISKATITKLRKGSNNLSKVPGEVHLKNKLYFKEVSGQVLQSYSDLEEKIKLLQSKPRYVIVTDYDQLLAKDEKTGDTLDIKFKELPRYFDFFLAWNGIEKADFEKENPADLKAAERFAKLFDELANDNEDADRHGLNLFLIRLLFCLFAEDTNIFAPDLFTNYLKQMTAADGSDMNERISELFTYLDKQDRIGDEPAYLKDFPYVNGSLFTEPHLHLNFSSKTRQLMIDAGELVGWASVNPDILGSMLQAVASEDKRSHLGMHYTSVPNIMKVIKPLFLDELREEFENSKGNQKKLNELYARIGKIKFMDPACGSGNFLIITYKELRQLEIDIIKELNNMGISTMYVPSVTLDQFYGIEIEDFACDVTRLSLWIAEHQMNVKLHQEIKDAVRPTLPLQKAGAIVCGNALRLDWNEVLPHDKDDEVYLFGNPPYLGAKKQSNVQKNDLFESLDRNVKFKKLDYISGWFFKGAKFVSDSDASLGFVTTNSITQGEQVAMLWPHIFKFAEISFAYQSFKWANNAKSNAGVMVEIIGLSARGKKSKKKLFVDERYKEVETISPYITEGSEFSIESSDKPLNSLMPVMVFGSMPRDNGNLILSEEEKNGLIDDGVDPEIIRLFIGSREFINSSLRYCLWMSKEQYQKNKKVKSLEERIEKTRIFREQSKAKSTREASKKPWEFVQKGEYEKAYGDNQDHSKEMTIIVPRVSSENRLYTPMGIVDSNTIIADSAMAIYDAQLWLLGLLESRMHMAWMRSVGGRLKTDYRYSAGLVYNTFPVPELSTRRKNEIEDLVLKILDIRDEEGGTLAELYGSPLAANNPKPMNQRLLKAHQELDAVVDRAYKPTGFKDDNERLSLLLEMYSKRVDERNEQ
ncbi:class I SAM-dependent DNA methyltransferase [Lactobacillus delbrueckii]|uniref:class I SAM-dependent DNA methyltransferase n=2 Tax=Lactobacillus delbrueckii TaxID=1584 RepID=UPI001E44324A|nr:DNA methyltransferase [Lactobacillus delbrueckii]MCD5535630.1 class I SAM-dependent DNA methyltransferase [Lactobacillus delbrueckii subsp. sunkii]